MSIDKAIAALQAALEANTAALVALTAAGGKAASGAAATTTKGAGKAAAASGKPSHTQAEVNAALIKLKDEFGVEHAKAIITEAGFKAMKDITEDKFDTVFAAAEAKYNELSDAGGI